MLESSSRLGPKTKKIRFEAGLYLDLMSFPLFCEYFYRFDSSFRFHFSPLSLCFIIIIIIARQNTTFDGFRCMSAIVSHSHRQREIADFTTCQTTLSDEIILHCHVCVEARARGELKSFSKMSFPSCCCCCLFTARDCSDVPVMRSSLTLPRSLLSLNLSSVR